MELIIDTSGTSISVKNKSFLIENKSIKRLIGPHRISSISISSNVNIQSSVVALAAKHNIPISFFNRYGKIEAQLSNVIALKNGLSRIQQYKYAESNNSIYFVKYLLTLKTEAQVKLIKNHTKTAVLKNVRFNYLNKNKEHLLKLNAISNLKINDIRNSLFGIEGNISRNYFKALQAIVPEPFTFSNRNRRPSLDYFNALLNYLYGCTYAIVTNAIVANKLDPSISLLHVTTNQNFTLSFDLIEPIRPLIDKMVLNLILNNQVTINHFNKNDNAVWLNSKGKRTVLTAYYKYINSKTTLDSKILTIKEHCYLIASNLKKEINKHVSNNL